MAGVRTTETSFLPVSDAEGAAFFGDSAGANLDSEIAVFVEQCYQKREMLRKKFNLVVKQPDVSVKAAIKSIPAKPEDVKSVKHVSKRL